MSDQPQQGLQRIESQLPATGEESSMLSIIARAASDPAVDVTKMERLMAMQERLFAKQAEQQFNVAMTSVQSKVRYIQKDAKNQQTNSSYAKLETINRAIVPVATEHGFSMSFGTADCPIADHIRVTCQVLHAGGHSRQYQCDVPIDMLGAKGNPNKTRTHGFGSSLTYGRRYLTLLIFNLSTGEDDDGNAAGGSLEGPEVIIGLKQILWTLLKAHHVVQSGHTWATVRQYLVDENILEPEQTIEELSAAELRKVTAKAKTKLEGGAQ